MRRRCLQPKVRMEPGMAKNASDTTWIEKKSDIILLTNRSKNNFILELPAGRMRLDAGRKIRTLRSILAIGQIKELVDAGDLVVEKP